VSTDMDSAPKWNHNDSDNLRDRSMRKRIGGITVRIGWFALLLANTTSRQVILDNSRGKND
jgi:hypothetical protein